MTEPRKRSRGVRLTDLDRTLVYRIAHTGRRWEVLGPEAAPGLPGAVDAGGGSAGHEVASTPYPAPRHRAPAADPY